VRMESIGKGPSEKTETREPLGRGGGESDPKRQIEDTPAWPEQVHERIGGSIHTSMHLEDTTDAFTHLERTPSLTGDVHAGSAGGSPAPRRS